jgi:hypothetical protein
LAHFVGFMGVGGGKKQLGHEKQMKPTESANRRVSQRNDFKLP